jgi:methylglutaconyl-CoA hydratase
MKNYKTIQFEIQDDIGWLILNRPDVRNAFNDEMISEMLSVFDTVKNTQKLNALVIRGNGPVFSAGADLNWMKKVVNYSYEQNKRESKKLQQLFDNIYHLPVPVIAQVHGASIGGANGLIAASDIVLAENETKFRFSEVKIGLVPATIAPYIIRRTGEYNAKYYMLTGRNFTPKEALRIGLIDATGNTESLDTELDIILKELNKNSLQAMMQTKKLINSISNSDNAEKIKELSLDSIAMARISEDGQEGMKAFLEKRNPRWLDNQS